MSAPTKADGGHSQLSLYIPTALKNEIAQLAAIRKQDQKALVEEALRAFIAKAQTDQAHAGGR